MASPRPCLCPAPTPVSLSAWPRRPGGTKWMDGCHVFLVAPAVPEAPPSPPRGHPGSPSPVQRGLRSDMLGPPGHWTALPQSPISPQLPPLPYAPCPHSAPGSHHDSSGLGIGRCRACLQPLTRVASGSPPTIPCGTHRIDTVSALRILRPRGLRYLPKSPQPPGWGSRRRCCPWLVTRKPWGLWLPPGLLPVVQRGGDVPRSPRRK